MKPPVTSAFLERRSYRRRRLIDAARMLPVVGMLLFLAPLLWSVSGPGTGRGGIYLFVAWGGLIVASALLARALSRPEPDDGETARRRRGIRAGGDTAEEDAP
jgi:hypothetical protein